MIKTLRKKFILINMLLLSAVLITVFAGLCYTRYRQARSENIRTLQMALDRAGVQRLWRFEIGQRPPSDFAKAPMFIVRVATGGSIAVTIAENVDIAEEHLVQIVKDALKTGETQGVLSGWQLRYMLKSEAAGVRIAFLDISSDRASIWNTILISSLLCAASIAAFFAISLFLSRWTLRPVERAWEQQKRFVADASHELKTPLTVILANIGILKSKGSSTIGEQSAWIENSEAEAKRMRDLIDDLLFLAKTDEAKTSMVCNKVNLSDVFVNAALALDSLAYERGIEISADGISPDVSVSGDEGQMRRLAGILLDNAIKYSSENDVITVELFQRQNRAVLTIHNWGAPLTPDDLEHLYDRFYRADKSRSKDGYGLGLSIAQSIVRAHRGSITAESGADKGTFFTVELPLFGDDK